MSRKTDCIVYVDKDVQSKPMELFDAALSHLIKKDICISRRKLFMAQFMKANSPEAQFEVIDAWIQVRDVAGFPFRKEESGLPEDAVIDELTDAAKQGTTAGKALRESVDGGISKDETQFNSKDPDENTKAEGSIPVDKKRGGKKKSGATSK